MTPDYKKALEEFQQMQRFIENIRHPYDRNDFMSKSSFPAIENALRIASELGEVDTAELSDAIENHHVSKLLHFARALLNLKERL